MVKIIATTKILPQPRGSCGTTRLSTQQRPKLTPRSKKRKRAHSSSPASSSQKQTSKHFANRSLPNKSAALHEQLKTPKADLVDDLWSRYSLHKSGERSPTMPSNAGFPKLMHSSSACSGTTKPRKHTGLRRAFSCIDWPTSASQTAKITRKQQPDGGSR